jgi:ABC-2 type transport system permease protein
MAFWTLYKRELHSYFQSIVAYIVLFSCAVLESCFFLILMRFILESHYKERSLMQIFFTWPLFWLLMLGPVPLLTMRVFSEEFKLGTIEMLLTAPVREWDVVLAKFFGAFTFFLITWLPIVLDLAALQIFSNPAPPLIWSQLLLTAMTLALLGGFYVSLGVFASVLTRNQIVAAVLSYAFILGAFLVSILRWFQGEDKTTLDLVSYVSGPEHFENAVEGIFDTRPIVFYLTITAFFIMLTQRILQARRLKG